MKAEKRSGAAAAAAGDRLVRRSGRDRLPTVRADFFLEPAERLTEQERALMSAMLHCLVAEIAGDLRSAFPDRRVAGEGADHALVERLNRAGLLDDPQLISILLRRADEERVASAAAVRSGRNEARVLQGLVSDDSPAVSAAAMALILARGRRRDRLGQCLLLFDDLPRETAVELVYRVAAALKQEGAIADRELAAAANKVIARHDSGKSTDQLAAALVEALGDGVGNELLLASANEGELGLLAHLLARSAGVPPRVAADELLSGDPASIIMLLRLANVLRPIAAGLVAAIGDLLGIDDPADAMLGFDALDKAALEQARELLLSDPAYRSALAALGDGHG